MRGFLGNAPKVSKVSEASDEFKNMAEGLESPPVTMRVEVPQEVAAWLAEAGKALSEPQALVTKETVAAQILRVAYLEDASGGDI